jgi:hypothetical protein
LETEKGHRKIKRGYSEEFRKGRYTQKGGAGIKRKEKNKEMRRYSRGRGGERRG